MKKVKTPAQNRVRDDHSAASMIFKIVCLTILALYAVSMIIMFVFGFLTSFKNPEVYRTDILSLPFGNAFTFKNYADVFVVMRVRVTEPVVTNVTIFGMLVNSLVFSVGGALISTVSCCVMAYAVAKFDNWMSKMIYGIVIVCMALPIVGSLPSELKVLITLNLYNKRIGLVLLAANFLGMHFLIFHASFKSIPKDFTEAAKIDGAGEWRIFLTIMIPLIRLTFMTIFLLKFMALWNNYETPMIHTPAHPVLALGVFNIAHYVNATATVGGVMVAANSRPHHLAAGMIVFIPMFIIFLFTHKRLIGNVSMGGIKG